MPGPSALPATAALSELASPAEDQTASADDELLEDSPAPLSSMAAEAAYQDKAAVEAYQDKAAKARHQNQAMPSSAEVTAMNGVGKAAAERAGAPGSSKLGAELCAAQPAPSQPLEQSEGLELGSSQPAQQPQGVAAALPQSKVEDGEQHTAFPGTEASAEAQKQCANAKQTAHSIVPADSSGAGVKDVSADSLSSVTPCIERNNKLAQHDTLASSHDGLVLPDSAGLSQQAPFRQHQPALDAVSDSSQPSPPVPDSDSIEAALALASLAAAAAAGQDTPGSKADAAHEAQQAEKVQGGHQGERSHKHCNSNRMPLRVVQKTAAVQRQPLKPAWQNPGKAGASWGAKARRTGIHRDKPCHRNRHANSSDGKSSPMDEDLQHHDHQGTTSLSCKTTGSGHLGWSDSDRHTAVSAANGNNSGPAGSETGIAGSKAGIAGKLPAVSTEFAAPSRGGRNATAETLSPHGQQQRQQQRQQQQQQRALPKSGIASTGLALQQQQQRTSPKSGIASTGLAQQQQQSSSPKHGIAAARVAQQACSKDNSSSNAADDDDFKPDVRRRARGPNSPHCSSRKRAKLSAEKLPCGAEQQAHTGQNNAVDVVGQALLCWNARRQQWDQKIIRSCGDSKVSG